MRGGGALCIQGGGGALCIHERGGGWGYEDHRSAQNVYIW